MSKWGDKWKECKVRAFFRTDTDRDGEGRVPIAPSGLLT